MRHERGPLTRRTDSKILGGVCAGFGSYFEVDTTLVRAVFLVSSVFAGAGVLLYLVLWAVVPAA